LPQKDIIFAGATLAAAQFLDLHTESIAAVLVLTTAADDVLGFLLVGVPWLSSRFSSLALRRLSPNPAAMTSTQP
jgi:hypothetical protein